MKTRRIKRRKPAHERRDAYFRARLTVAQRKLIRQAARLDNRTPSAWGVAAMVQLAERRLTRGSR